jgi:hypothetical protein
VLSALGRDRRAFVFALSSCSNTHLLSPATGSLHVSVCPTLNHATRLAAVYKPFQHSFAFCQ